MKILKIFRLYFCGKKGHENVFHDIVEKKNAFLKYENKELKKTKNWDFSKGIVHSFRYLCTLGRIGLWKCLSLYLEKKNAL